MDRGAWRAIVHGVTKSQTRLKRLSVQCETELALVYPSGCATITASQFHHPEPCALSTHSPLPPSRLQGRRRVLGREQMEWAGIRSTFCNLPVQFHILISISPGPRRRAESSPKRAVGRLQAISGFLFGLSGIFSTIHTLPL